MICLTASATVTLSMANISALSRTPSVIGAIRIGVAGAGSPAIKRCSSFAAARRCRSKSGKTLDKRILHTSQAALLLHPTTTTCSGTNNPAISHAQMIRSAVMSSSAITASGSGRSCSSRANVSGRGIASSSPGRASITRNVSQTGSTASRNPSSRPAKV